MFGVQTPLPLLAATRLPHLGALWTAKTAISILTVTVLCVLERRLVLGTEEELKKLRNRQCRSR